MEFMLKGLSSALIAYSAHYGVAKLYDQFCVPDGFWGYMQGFVTTGSPVCNAGVQIMSATQVSYSTMVLMGVTRLAIDWVAPGAGNAIPH